jgi:hypothetical protein
MNLRSSIFRNPLWWRWPNRNQIFSGIFEEGKTLNHKRAIAQYSSATTTATTNEIKSEFPQLSRIQIILIAIFTSLVLFILLCVILCQIYKRSKIKKQQSISENQDEITIESAYQSTKPMIYHICTDVNSTAFLYPSVSTTFTVSSSHSTSRFQEHFNTDLTD